jgi:2,4-diacetylphloroglucinol hydrolase
MRGLPGRRLRRDRGADGLRPEPHRVAGVTTEMFQWWYIWSSLAKEHVLLWFPYAHIDAFVEDPKRLADQSLSFEERLYHNRSHYEQYVGPTLQKVILEYRDPVELGLDAAMLKREGITASTSSIASLAAAPDVTSSLIVHLARDTEGGMELFSRFWIGGHPEFKRFPGGDTAAAAMARSGPDGKPGPRNGCTRHDRIRPSLQHCAPLYERFGTPAAA